MATETCQVKLDKDTKDKIEALSKTKEHDRSINKMIKKLYEYYMDSYNSHQK